MKKIYYHWNDLTAEDIRQLSAKLPCYNEATGNTNPIDTYRREGNYVIQESPEYDPYWHSRVEIYNEPAIGQKYMVVFYCDYDNSEYGSNYTIEVTEENIAEIAYHMNDTENDITDYFLIEQ